MTVIDEFEEEFKKFIGVKHAIACNNGTAALHTAVSAFGVGRGDKVVTTPFTFVATANCILFNDGIPIFADIDPKTYLIDPEEVEKKILKHKRWSPIKGIICVHLFGRVCNISALMRIAKKYNLWLIEDCSQALGARYRGIHVGNFGNIGIFSFYATKQLWTFEGGMIVTNDDKLARFCRMFIDQGQSEKYIHKILGYNYRMPQICALIGLTQLKLHKKGILAELGSYGIERGYYPKVIYNQPLYKEREITGNCPNAEEAARQARKYFKRKMRE